METGFRHTQRGERVPRNIITRFVCTYDGTEVMRAILHPARSARLIEIERPQADGTGGDMALDRCRGAAGKVEGDGTTAECRGYFNGLGPGFGTE